VGRAGSGKNGAPATEIARSTHALEILDDPTAEEGKEQVPYKRDVASLDGTLEKRSITPIETTFAGECD
jgi:hypothetical protein